MKKVSFILFGLAFLAGFILSSCEENKEENLTSGKIKISITDAPFDISLIDEAKITIEEIELRSKDSVEGGPFITIMDTPTEISLLDLTNGVTEQLIEAEVPVGSFDLIRVKISNSSIRITEGTEFDLKVPSGSSSGMKIFVSPEINVEGGLTSELLLDFDVSRSFVPKGDYKNIEDLKGFNFKPVIRAVNMSTAGRIEGFLIDEENSPIGDAKVWIEKDTVVATTYSDSTGYYALIGIPEGNYDLFAHKETYDTIQYENVSVVASNKSEIDLQLIHHTE